MRRLFLIASADMAPSLWADHAARAEFMVVFGQSSYDVAPGTTVDVAVYLRETGGTVLATDGLFSAGFVVAFNESPFATDPAQVTNRSANAEFDLVTTSPLTAASSSSAGSADLDVARFANPGVVSPVAPATDRILLGVFTFQAGNLAGEETRLRLADLDPGLDNFVTGAGVALDTELSFGTSRIASVPEPTSLILLGLGLGLGSLVIRRGSALGGRPVLILGSSATLAD